MVVSEKHPLNKCPHIQREELESAQQELDDQHAAGKWTKRDMAADALRWAKERAASMEIPDLPSRIGGRLAKDGDTEFLELPYFTGKIYISQDGIFKSNGDALGRWE